MVTMYTTGMSDRRMAVDPGHEDLAYAELVLFLPPDFPIGGSGGQELRGPDGAVFGVIPNLPSSGASAVEDPRLAWATHWLQGLARYPHAEKTWVGPGHMIPTGESEPLLGTGFSGFVLLEPLSFPSEVVARDGRHIQLHTLFPLYPEEIEFKRTHGTTELIRRFAQAGLSEIADPKRPNVGDKPKKRGWRFW